MRRESVGERRGIWIFETATPKIPAETRGDADLNRNPGAIPAFIPSFSDLP
jgi:hypothetical protein